MHQSARRSRSIGPSAAAFRDVLRRLDAIERRLRSRSSAPVHGDSDLLRRWEILEEERLRRRVAKDTALRHQDPARRLQQLCTAIKLVYASACLTHARRYLESVGLDFAEAKMAVEEYTGRVR